MTSCDTDWWIDRLLFIAALTLASVTAVLLLHHAAVDVPTTVEIKPPVVYDVGPN